MGREEHQHTVEQGVTAHGHPDDRRSHTTHEFGISHTGVTGSPLPTTDDPETTRHGIEFAETVDMVSDMGCDPTGTRPIDEKIEHAAKHDRLLIFPTGTYRVSGDIELGHLRNFGIYGKGKVTFRVDPDVQGWVPHFDAVENGLFEGITIDQSAAGAIAWTRFGTTGRLHIEDVTVKGTDDVADTDKRKWRCMIIGRDPGASITVKDFVSQVDDTVETHSDDSGGVFISPNNKATVNLVNCKLLRDPGLHATESQGRVLIRGGVYRLTDANELILPPHSETRNVTVLETG